MIKINSKVIIKQLLIEDKECIKQFIEKMEANKDLTTMDLPDSFLPPVMIVEGLYNVKGHPEHQEYQRSAKCLWYNTRNELQSECINLEILTEL